MADQVSAGRRQRKLASYHRRVADRRERGLCVKCGRAPAHPERMKKSWAAGNAASPTYSRDGAFIG